MGEGATQSELPAQTNVIDLISKPPQEMPYNVRHFAIFIKSVLINMATLREDILLSTKAVEIQT